MKVLFFPLYPKTPHLETEMELMANHLERNDTIYVCKCQGNLEKCFMTLKHNKKRCILCQNRTSAALNYLNIPKENIIPLKDLKIEYDILPEKFENVEELMKFTLFGYKFGLAAASNLIFLFQKNHKFNTIKNKNIVKKQLRTVLYIYHFMTILLKHAKPHRFYFFNGRFTVPRTLIFACKETNTNFYTYERAGTIKRYILRKNTFPHDTFKGREEIKNLWSNAEEKKREIIAHKWFKERRNSVDQGWFSYIKEQKDSMLPNNFNKSKTNIVIFNSTLEEKYTLLEFRKSPIYNNEIDGIEDIVESLRDKKNFSIYLRMHPNLIGLDNFQTQYYKKLNKKYSNLTVIEPYSKVSSYALLDHSDIIITFGSTLGVEATYWGKPSILLSDAFYRDIDVAYQPKTKKELLNLIYSDLKPKDKENALKYGYWQKNRGIKYEKYKPFSITSGIFKSFSLERIKFPFIIGKKILIINIVTDLLFESLFNLFFPRYKNSDLKKKIKNFFTNLLVQILFTKHQ